MSDIIFITMILIHFLADFGLQTHDQATKKSSSGIWLSYHVGVYSLIWIFGAFIISNSWFLSFWFGIITFICHFITDLITSKISKPFFDKKNFHDGFVVIGFDQLLHMLQLWICIKYLLIN